MVLFIIPEILTPNIHYSFSFKPCYSQPAKKSVSPHSSPMGTFRAEERLRLSGRNSILMTQTNVYIINPVVTNLSNFTCLLVDFGKVLCSSAKELQQNSIASSREDYIPEILTVLLEILRVYI